MPFIPWKKNKVTPISQILADLQSPKHASSLVVQTGFPTSVIDLFAKNRTRFRKPNSKKPVHREISDPPPPPISPAPPPPPKLPETSSSSGFAVVSSEDPSLTPSVIANDNVHGDDGGSGSGRETIRVGECGGGSGSKTVLASVLKMFVVAVVLITSVKQLTVGITFSAFLLLFLEYTGKRVVSCLRPCSDANVGIIKCLAEKFCSWVWFQKLCEGSESLIVEGENNIVMSELVVGAECSSVSLSFEEIEVVEKKSEVVGVCCEETLCCPEMQEDSNVKVVDSCEISQCKTKDSRNSVKLKSKMVKKLVPKKLRGSKKDKREKKSKERKDETNSEEDKSLNFEIEEEREGVQKVEVENGIRSQLLLKNELEEVDHGITCSQDSSLARMADVALTSEEKRIDRVGNSGYTILFVIALAGLVVGRFPAMILTMAWCFMLKIVTTGERSESVPLIQCSVTKS